MQRSMVLEWEWMRGPTWREKMSKIPNGWPATVLILCLHFKMLSVSFIRVFICCFRFTEAVSLVELITAFFRLRLHCFLLFTAKNNGLMSANPFIFHYISNILLQLRLSIFYFHYTCLIHAYLHSVLQVGISKGFPHLQ